MPSRHRPDPRPRRLPRRRALRVPLPASRSDTAPSPERRTDPSIIDANPPARPAEPSTSRLLLRLHVISAATAIVGAALIFNFQDVITPVVQFSDFCESRTVIEISEAVFPKLATHCDLLTDTGLRDHPRAGIAIVLDVYFVLAFFVLSVITGMTILRTSPAQLDRVRDRLEQNKYVSISFGLFVFGLLAIFQFHRLFVFSELVSPPGGPHKTDAILDETFGIGPAWFAFVFSCSPNWYLLALATYVRARSGRSARREDRPPGDARTADPIPEPPPVAAGGESGTIPGWIGFVALSMLWPPLWFGGVFALPPDGFLLAAGLAWCAAAICAVIRTIGFPRAAWLALAGAAAATVPWSLATLPGAGAGDPWAGPYQIFMIGMVGIDGAASLFFLYLVKRRSGEARPRDQRGGAA